MISARFLLALKLITLIFFLFVFAYKTATFVDPDLGWHLRAGEIVAQTGQAPMIDPWNYVINDQEWIDHEWLLDLFLWNAWIKGYWPIALLLFFLFAFSPIVTWILRTRSSLQLLFVAVGASVIWPIIGVRPQALSFLFFFILYELLVSEWSIKIRKIAFFFLPILFALWANLHAGFVAGLAFWVIVFFIQLYEKIRATKFTFRYLVNIESASLLFSFIATLFTPYHLTLWREIITSTTSPLIAYVAEWQMPLSRLDVPLIIFLGAGAALIFASRKMLPLREVIPMIFFFVSYMQHARMAPFFFITALPPIQRTLVLLSNNTQILIKELPSPHKHLIILAPSLLLLAMLAYNGTSSMLREPYEPPYEAIRAVQSIPHESCNVFNDYGFGGWMIFENPNAKVFIDGRSPHWKAEDGTSPFADYVELIKKPDTWNTVFEKHHICIVILASELDNEYANDISKTPSLWMNTFTKLANLFYPSPSHAQLSATLKDAGWCTVYSDSKAIILLKPGSPLCAYK